MKNVAASQSLIPYDIISLPSISDPIKSSPEVNWMTSPVLSSGEDGAIKMNSFDRRLRKYSPFVDEYCNVKNACAKNVETEEVRIY